MASYTAQRAGTIKWWLLALLVSSCCINYMDRGILSVAAPLVSRELSLTPVQLGLLFSSFFWTYALLQIGAGWLVDRFDVYKVFGTGLFVWSAATALTGLSSSFGAILALRVLLGIGESVAYPAYSRILVTEFPERSARLDELFG